MYIIKGELERFRLTLIVGKTESPVAGIQGQGVAEIPVIGCLCTRVAHLISCTKPSPMEFWGYTNQVRLRGLTENSGFCNLLKAGASLCSCGFNRQVQDMSHATTIAYPQQISFPKHNSSLERIDAE